MSLRTKIVVWFLLLSVLPLAAIVSYSYLSSSRALRRAVKQETWELAGGLDEHMKATRAELGDRMRQLHGLPWEVLLADAGGSGEVELGHEKLLRELTPFVDSLEFVPSAPPAPLAPPAPAREARSVTVVAPGSIAGSQAGAGGETADVVARVRVAPGRAPGGAAPEKPPKEGDPRFTEPVVIELDALLQASPESLAAAWKSDEVLADWDGAGLGDLGPRSAFAALGAMKLAIERGGLGPEDRRKLEEVGRHLSEIYSRAVRKLSTMEEKERARLEARMKESSRVLGREYAWPVEMAGEEIGSLRAGVLASRVVAEVLGRTDRSQREIPFAFDADGRVYLADPEDRAPLEAVGLIVDGRARPDGELADWVVAYLTDEESDLTFGVARPIKESVRELRATAGRNFGLGFGLVGIALIGVVPLSRRLTRDLEELTAGSERLAAGNWDVRVPVRSRDEVGKLAQSFNRLARELSDNQKRLLDTQLQQKLLQAENERKGHELEEAREFQFSLLPGELPRHPDVDIAVFMRTATEVGGDYYDFRQEPGGALTAVIGDATGHGARAGTMVTVIKSLFTAWPPSAALADFLGEAAAAVKSMNLGRMAMAVALARIENGRLRVSSAGMPPALVRRSCGTVEEIALSGLPLGGMARSSYQEREIALAPGDTILLMSDGFPELPDEAGEPIGYDRVRRLLEESTAAEPQALIDELAGYATRWHRAATPADDITFVVLRVRG